MAANGTFKGVLLTGQALCRFTPVAGIAHSLADLAVSAPTYGSSVQMVMNGTRSTVATINWRAANERSLNHQNNPFTQDQRAMTHISRTADYTAPYTGPRYRASAALEAFIVANAPYHVARKDAPTTLAGLQARKRDSLCLKVSDEFSQYTIYSAPQVNYAFRAWHNALHLELNAEFNEEGELLVARAHEKAVREAIAAGVLTEMDCCALFFETWGQFRYAQEHGGTFPTDQAAFIAACFSRGMSAAILMDF
jgi:hypothetical protein